MAEQLALDGTAPDAVPVFVREVEGGYALVRSSDGTVLGEAHPRVRAALDAALASYASALKTPNLRTDGEPDGAWRWIDATAEEEDAKGGVRVDAPAIWSMAARLNARASAVPVDGGGSPGPGYATSAPHGTADDPATPANGFMHVGIPVEGAERTHLFVRAELLPEIAREFDRGRLAYSSVHFRWDVEPDETGHVEGATLASLALLNDPAVTTLTPGSERQAVRMHTRALERTNPMTAPNKSARALLALSLALALRAAADPSLAQTLRTAAPKDAKRGAALEKLRALAATLGMSVEEALGGDEYRPMLVDRVCTLVEAGKLEQVLEAGAAPQPVPPVPPAETEGARQAVRAVEGLDAAQLEAAFTSMLALGREVLGKPTAAPAEVLAELVASKDALAAAIAKPAPNGLPAEEKPPAPVAPPAPKPEDEEKAALAAAERAELAWLRARKRLGEECATRGVALDAATTDRWTALAVKSGWEPVLELLDQEKALKPPSGPSVMGAPAPAVRAAPSQGANDAPKTVQQATKLCMDEAREALRQAGHKNPPTSFVISQAQRIGAQRWPALGWGKKAAVNTSGAPRAAGSSV